MSRLFLRALLGLSLTAIGLTDVVDWPLWPATLTLEHGFGIRDPFEDRATREKAAILVALIAANSTIWALLACGVMSVLRRFRGNGPEPLNDKTDPD